jgi:hypothetical protein
MKYLVAVALVSLLTLPSIAAAQSAAPAGRCAALTDDWKSGEMELADNEAAGLSDDSAPRATMRATQDVATYTRASLILNLMEANHCSLPARAPAATTYLSAALDCRLARMKATLDEVKAGIAACDRSKWVQGITPAAK